MVACCLFEQDNLRFFYNALHGLYLVLASHQKSKDRNHLHVFFVLHAFSIRHNYVCLMGLMKNRKKRKQCKSSQKSSSSRIIPKLKKIQTQAEDFAKSVQRLYEIKLKQLFVIVQGETRERPWTFEFERINMRLSTRRVNLKDKTSINVTSSLLSQTTRLVSKTR